MSDYVEKPCVFEHEGKRYEAGGAYVQGDRALVYITTRKDGGRHASDWHGNILGEVLEHKLGSRRFGRRDGFPYRMAFVRVRMNGRDWHGSYNHDMGQAVQLRAYK